MVPHMLPTGKLLTLPMPECPWSQLAVDFLTDLPESLGNSVIIVIIDWFSKSLSLVPQPGLFTALKTAELTFNHVFRYTGIPEYINRARACNSLQESGLALWRIWSYPYASSQSIIPSPMSKQHVETKKSFLFSGHSVLTVLFRRIGLFFFPMGWICHEFPLSLRNTPNTLPVCAWLPTTHVLLEC